MQISENLGSQRFFGGYKAVVRPDPIPNSAVKRSIADGSACIACARVGCRQILSKGRTQGFGFFLRKGNIMSQHRSLRALGGMSSKRSVLKRFERVELLKKRGLWKEGDSVVGLRKTKPEA